MQGAAFADASVLGSRLADLLASPEILALQARRARDFTARRDAEARAGLDRIIALLDAGDAA